MQRAYRYLVGITLIVTLAAVAVFYLAPPRATQAQTPGPALAPITVDRDFWSHWGDGQAEIATYDLVYPRYGELRKGSAVAIFVTETFSNSLRVKADPGKHPKSDEFPVIKLNLVQDFQTGIYDYNMMTSAFVALDRVNRRPTGSPTKVSFSAQEWCGHAYHQALFDESKVRQTMHSYFDGEADQSNRLEHPSNGMSEDTLLLWARGLAAPAIKRGQTTKVKMLRSLEHARLLHREVDWLNAALSRSEGTTKVTVPAGTFTVETLTAQVDDGKATRTWTFHVEHEHPRRLIAWSCTDGRSAKLIAAKRLKYWQLNANKDEKTLTEIGLKSRPPRTP